MVVCTKTTRETPPELPATLSFGCAVRSKWGAKHGT
jgi:hypothetical protein